MKKLRQRQRTTRIFIDAAVEIINEEGIDALTIRKVAEQADYNSATLYNYFDNLKHLKSLTALYFMSDYTNSLDECIKNCHNAFEVNEAVWLCFYRHSYRLPKIYQSIFNRPGQKSHNIFITEFYELYPEHLNVKAEAVKGMMVEENLFDRTMYLLKECAKENFFKESDLEAIYELLFFIYQGMLNKLLLDHQLTEDQFVEQAKVYIDKILYAYKLKNTQ